MNDKYPRYTSDFADLSACIDAYLLDGLPSAKIITPASKVFAQGSCFATNISAALAKRSVSVSHRDVIESANSPMGNAQGLLMTGDDVSQALKSVDVFVFTMGVALERVSEAAWRFSSVEENVSALRAITQHLRSINPLAQIIYTVSPVPLNRAIGLGMPGAMADCVSKSTLRVAVDSYLREAPTGVFYWPSFEIVRWFGAHSGPAYGADDGLTRHVNQQLIDLIVSKFLQHFAALDPQ